MVPSALLSPDTRPMWTQFRHHNGDDAEGRSQGAFCLEGAMIHGTTKPRNSNGTFDSEDLEERFWSKVNIPHGCFGCWEWIGAKTSKDNRAYGQIYVAGRLVLAHRLAWKLVHGYIPAGLWILHHCDNRLCCNPSHLFTGTRSDNMIDCAMKGRLPITRLTTEDVLNIMELLDTEQTLSDIARAYGVGRKVVSDIKRKRTRRYLPEARRVMQGKEG